MLTRREERELAFLLLFESDFNYYNLDEILENKNEIEEVFTLTDFVKEVFRGVKEHQYRIDVLISKHSLKWNKDRISKVAITILRLAIYEILFKDDIPQNVSINEAIELAKKYGLESEPVFVNGVLGSICKESKENLLNELNMEL